MSFWLRLWPHLRRGRYDILHVQDPMVAYWCRMFRHWGLVKTREILAHGTEETAEFLGKFDYVQHLAPWHLEAGGGKREEGGGKRGRVWKAIPNFVDCDVFKREAGSGKREECVGVRGCGSIGVEEGPNGAEMRLSRQELREKMGIPADAFVVGCVAAVKKDHKRIDYLIREVAVLSGIPSLPGGEGQGEGYLSGADQHPHPSPLPSRERELGRGLFLLLAGARTAETHELIALAEELIPGRYKILLDCPRDRMPDLYRAMDVFVLPSLFEMMPIALLEALASGVPCVVNHHPVLEWMVGSGGEKQGEEVRGQRAEVRGKKSEVRSQKSEVRSQKSEVRSQKSEVRGRESGVRGRGAEDVTTDGCGLAQIPANPQPITNNTRPEAGGIAIDMSREGALAEALAGLNPEWFVRHSQQARKRAVTMFSKEAVIGQYIEYYEEVMRESGRAGSVKREA